jgi:hypothetical protein
MNDVESLPLTAPMQEQGREVALRRQEDWPQQLQPPEQVGDKVAPCSTCTFNGTACFVGSTTLPCESAPKSGTPAQVVWKSAPTSPSQSNPTTCPYIQVTLTEQLQTSGHFGASDSHLVANNCEDSTSKVCQCLRRGTPFFWHQRRACG